MLRLTIIDMPVGFWMLEMEPVVMQINGDLPEAQVRQYAAALQAMP